LESTAILQTKGKEKAVWPSRPVRNVISNWATYLLGGIVSFFLSPFIVRHLGNSAYGIWVLLVSLTGYLGFLDLGIRGAVTRYIAKFHTEGNHEQSRRTVSSACCIFLMAGTLAVVTAVGFAFLVVPRFHIPSEYVQSAQTVVLITGVTIAMSLISGIFGGLLIGLQRFGLMNLVALSGIVFRSTATVLALKSGRGLVTLAIIQLVSTATELVLGFVLSRRLYPEARIGVRDVRREQVFLVLSFGLFALLLQLSNYLVFYTDALVIGAFLPVSMITFFAIGANLTIYARDLVGGVSRTMTPLASRLEVEAGRQRLRETTLRAGGYCTLIMAPVFVTFIIRGKSFIGLWMGPAYAELSGHVLWILSIPWLFGAGTSVAASAILGIGKHRPVVPAALAEALSNIVLSVALIRAMGIVGVAWGTAIPNLVVGLLFWPWYIRKTLGASIKQYVTSMWILPGFATLPFALCTYGVEHFWVAKNLPIFFAQVVAVLPTMLVGFWMLRSKREVQKSVFQQIQEL
jgi:O-antigen/teichoic acid export membrane protein